MGKLDALRRALVRYLDRPATQGHPKSKAMSARMIRAEIGSDGTVDLPDDIPDEVAEAIRSMMSGGMMGGAGGPASGTGGRGTMPRQPHHHADETQESDPTGDTPDHMSWATWKRVSAELVRPGWAFGRFAMRTNEDRAAQMFGTLRGNFGVSKQSFYCCDLNDGEDKVLASLCHLSSGTGIGVFVTYDMACEAAEIMERMNVDWANVDPLDNEVLQASVDAAWNAAGLYPAHFHAHPQNCDGHVRVWFKNHHSTMLGKPASFGGLS